MRTHEPTVMKNRKKRPKAYAAPVVAIALAEEETQATQAPSSSRDDLSVIDGIDPMIEMALNDIGIQRFADFQAYTPETLEQALEARAGISVPAETIATYDWFGWAQIFVDEPAAQFRKAGSDEEPNKEEVMPALRADESDNLSTTPESALHPSTADAEKIVVGDAVPDPGQAQKVDSAETPPQENVASDDEPKTPRREVETVVAEKIRKAAHRKNGGKSTQRACPEKTESATPQRKSTTSKAAPCAKDLQLLERLDKEVALRINHAKFMQQEMPAAAGLVSEKMLHGEIGYELEMANLPALLPQPLTLCAQIHAVDLSTGVTELLASKSQAVLPNQHGYRADVDFNVPRIGRYQLQVVAMLLGAQPAIDCRQGPKLRVEE